MLIQVSTHLLMLHETLRGSIDAEVKKIAERARESVKYRNLEKRTKGGFWHYIESTLECEKSSQKFSLKH